MNIDMVAIEQGLKQALPNVDVVCLKNAGPSGQDSFLVAGKDLVAVMTYFRDGLKFDYLSNVSGVDWVDPSVASKVMVGPEGWEGAPKEGFLEVVYQLYSVAEKKGPLVVRARTADRDKQTQVPSVVSVYRSAEFQEREVYDLYGVEFVGHPDLRRILMWDEFEDHPMRKDYVNPDDYEYEPTPHDQVLTRAKQHYPSQPSAEG